MSDNEESGFLGRWAKRKAQMRAKEQAEPIDATEPQGELSPKQNQAAAQAAEEEAEPFDLASLPGLDDITGQTDVTAFLRKGVPEFLRNAALKRAWAADPGIRDYVNPAMEYAFDWNVIGGVPGSGELEAGYDAASQVAQMFSTPIKVKDEEGKDEEGKEGAHTLVASTSAEAAGEGENIPAASVSAASEPVRLTANPDAGKGEKAQTDQSVMEGSGNPAEPRSDERAPSSTPPIRRRHGGAAPT